MTFYFNRNEIIEELDQLPDEKKLNFIIKKLYMIDKFYEDAQWEQLPLEVRGLKKELSERKAVYEKFNFNEVGQTITDKTKWNGTKTEFADFVNDQYLENQNKYQSLRDAAFKLFDKYEFEDKEWTNEQCYGLARK